MNDNYGINSIAKALGFNFKRKPICSKCKFQKKGIETFCEQYRMKPLNVIEGGYCNKYHPIGE